MPEQDQGDGKPFGEQPGHLRYLRFSFSEPVRFQAGRMYAFLIGFESPGKDQGLGLANQHTVHSPAPAEFLRDSMGSERWGVRREGNGKQPPTMLGGPNPPEDARARRRMVAESMFPRNHWDKNPPTTDGYPDVDTYRNLEFTLEFRP